MPGRMRFTKLGVGDVFTIPLDEGRVGVGQIVGTYEKHAYYLAVFESAIEDAALDVDLALSEWPLLLALSLDALFHAGRWGVVTNRPVDPAMPLPAFKVMVKPPDSYEVEDYSGQRRRPARGRESDWLPFRKIVAPIRLEKAFRAYHGLEQWEDHYDELKPSRGATTARLLGP